MRIDVLQIRGPWDSGLYTFVLLPAFTEEVSFSGELIDTSFSSCSPTAIAVRSVQVPKIS